MRCLFLTFFLLAPVVSNAAVCGLLTTQPQGYGSPLNFFSGDRELTVKAECEEEVFIPLIGSTRVSDADFAVYTLGYYWTGNEWLPYALEPRSDRDHIVGSWVMGDAVGPTIEYISWANPTYFVAYSCHWVNNSWRCGCQTSSCTRPAWQLQAVEQPYAASGGYSNLSGDGSGSGSGSGGNSPAPGTHAVDVTYDDYPLGRFSDANQRAAWGYVAHRHPENMVIVDSGEGFKVLREQLDPNDVEPGRVFPRVAPSDSYCIETRFRHSPNFREGIAPGTKFMLGFSGGRYQRGDSPPDLQRKGSGGGQLVAVSSGNSRKGLIRDYFYHMDNPSNTTADQAWQKRSFDSNWHTMRICATLNAPGQRDGLYQVWFDGQQVVNRTDMRWRGPGETWQWDSMRLLARASGNFTRPVYNEYQYHRMWIPE